MSDRHPTDAHGAEQQQAAARRSPALEWIVSLLGFVLVAGLIGLLFYDAFEPGTPPQLQAKAGRVTPMGDRYHVAVTVTNDGGTTAASVKVEGWLERNGETIETASTTYDYVPADSKAEGGVLFTRDPRTHRLRLEASAYASP